MIQIGIILIKIFIKNINNNNNKNNIGKFDFSLYSY